jgi:hypothetical protein
MPIPLKRWPGILAIGVVGAVVLGLFVLYAPSLYSERIDPAEVNLLNMGVFKQQLRNDLPLGTAKEEVEVYLDRRKLTYHFVGPEELLPSSRNTFHLLIEDVGPPLILLYLEIRIHLSDDNKIRETEFRLTY